MNLRLDQIREAMQASGDLLGLEDRVPAGISTDSRTILPGALFVCLPGQRFDGHDHAARAATAGAMAVVGQRETMPALAGPAGEVVPYLRVDDSVAALGRLALAWRRRYAGTVVGVTGTAGKTTVKELLAHLLAGLGKTARNRKNLNNHIGLPCSMLAADGDEAFWVMETGINFVGDMAPLAAMLEPDMVVAVNAGAGHLEGLKDVATVAREKSLLIAALRPGGEAVVNWDGEELRQAAIATGKPLVPFSTANHAEARYQGRHGGVCLGERGSMGRHDLILDGEAQSAAVPAKGSHLTQSVLAAATAAHRLGLSPSVIARRLASVDLPEQRFSPRHMGLWLVIDDSYNANPVSMTAALHAAKELAGEEPLALALGEMRELGDSAPRAHQELGRLAGSLRPLAVFWKGGYFENVALGLAESNPSLALRPIATPEGFAAQVASLPGGLDGGVLLCKGSRANRLEDCVEALRATLISGAGGR